MKNLRVVKYIAVGSIEISLHLISMLAMVNASVAGEIAIPQPPKNVDEIVKNIHDIVESDGLANEAYYSEKLGLVMQAGELSRVEEPNLKCGLATASRVDENIEKVFFYKTTPWFFDGNMIHDYRCTGAYRKDFLKNGVVRVYADVKIDPDKVCIRENDVKRYFPSGDYVDGVGGYEMRYSTADGGNIRLTIHAPPASPKCAVYVHFSKNDQ